MARDASVWFVMIGGKQTGPLSRAELGLQCQSGAISGKTYVWKQGMAAWTAGAKIVELAALFGSAPRVRARPPPPPPVDAEADDAPAAPAAGKPRPAGKPHTVLKAASRSTSTTASARSRAPAPVQKPKKEIGQGLMELDTAHFRLADLKAQKEDDGLSRQSEFNTAHFRLSDLPQAQGGTKEDEGPVSEFNTAHFRLADLKQAQAAAKEDAGPISEFNTAHFKLSDLPLKDTGKKGEPISEFNTAHFRLADLKEEVGGRRRTMYDEGPIDLDLEQKAHEAGVVGYADAGGAPKAAAKGQPAPARGKAAPAAKPKGTRQPLPFGQELPDDRADAGQEVRGPRAQDLAQWASLELAKGGVPQKPGSAALEPRTKPAPVTGPAAKAAPAAAKAAPAAAKAAPVAAKSGPAAALRRPAAPEAEGGLLQLVVLGVLVAFILGAALLLALH